MLNISPSSSCSFPEQLIINFGHNATIFINVLAEAKSLRHIFPEIREKKPTEYKEVTVELQKSVWK